MGKSFIKLPKIGESIPKATLVSWLKDVGDEIEEGDPLIEISIDQVNSFVPSEFSGELKEKRFKIGDIIKPGEVIAEIENEDEDEDEDEIDEGESNLENELNTNTQNLVEAGTKSAVKNKILYFISSVVIIIFTTWIFLKWNTEAEMDLNKELNIPKNEVEVDSIPEQIITAPPEEIIKVEKKKIATPKKTKIISSPKVNKTEKKKVEEEEYKDDCLDQEIAFGIIEDVPIFPGCEKVSESERRNCFQQQMNAHIRRNFRYPEIAQEMGIQGRVYVNFIIAKDGQIKNIRMRGPDKNLEKEAQRIIAKLPKMTPGMQKGCAVNVPFSIPITFRLQ